MYNPKGQNKGFYLSFSVPFPSRDYTFTLSGKESIYRRKSLLGLPQGMLKVSPLPLEEPLLSPSYSKVSLYLS
jgi:hypothetical protein